MAATLFSDFSREKNKQGKSEIYIYLNDFRGRLFCEPSNLSPFLQAASLFCEPQKNYRQKNPNCPSVVFIYTFRRHSLATCSTVSRNVSVVECYLLVKHPSVNDIHMYSCSDVLMLSVQNSAKFLLFYMKGKYTLKDNFTDSSDIVDTKLTIV